MNTITPKFQINQVKCNGVLSLNLVSKDNTDAIQTYVSTYRQLEDFATIVANFNDDKVRYYGTRCSSDESITYRITSALTEYALRTFKGDEQLSEMWINAQVELFNGQNMSELVKEGLRDCSEADQWYTFEKSY